MSRTVTMVLCDSKNLLDEGKIQLALETLLDGLAEQAGHHFVYDRYEGAFRCKPLGKELEHYEYKDKRDA